MQQIFLDIFVWLFIFSGRIKREIQTKLLRLVGQLVLQNSNGVTVFLSFL